MSCVVWVIILTSLSLITKIASADRPLNDMIEDNGFDWVKGKKIYAPKLTNDVDPDSNYARIFKKPSYDSPSAALIINDWLGLPDIEFPADPSNSKSARYAGSCAITKRAFFEATHDVLLSHTSYAVHVYVPFPTFASVGDTKLIPKLSKLEPPYLKVLKTEDKTIAGFPAKIYLTEDKTCTINIKLPKTSLLFAFVEKCDEYKQSRLETLVGSLNIKRLASKLDS